MTAPRAPAAPTLEAGAWLVLAAGMWIYSYRFDGDFPAYLWGPVSWPRAVLAAIVVLALVQLVLRTVLASRRGSSAASADTQRDDDSNDDARGSRHDARGAGAGGLELQEEWRDAQSGTDARLRIFATFTLPLLYLLLLPRTGYFITTPLFLIAYMVAFREHSVKYMLVTAALLYLGSLAIFSKLLFVPLPTGNWPGFYDFSNWLLEILHAI